MKLTPRAGNSAVWLAAFFALVVPSAQAKVRTAGGSLQLTVSPSPPCGEFTFPGSCNFEPSGKVKVKSRPECRGRDVKIYRVDVGALVDTPGTSHRRGTASDHLGGSYTAIYPGTPTNNPVYEPIGGTRMSFRAIAPRFKTFVHNNPLRPLICKRLKSTVDEVAVPMPPPPEP